MSKANCSATSAGRSPEPSSRTVGLLEQSHGGTIFLDEVADIPPALQVKLLRTVEHGEVLPVGAGRPIQIDLRVVSATHQNLHDRVADGSFRHDLYFRLSTFQIDVPPLRARRDDIPSAGRTFFGDAWREERRAPAAAFGRSAGRVGAAALVRQRPRTAQCRRACADSGAQPERSVSSICRRPQPLRPADSAPAETRASEADDRRAGPALGRSPVERDGNGQNVAETEGLYEQLLELVEPPLLEAVLAQHHGQRAAAARTLGLHRMTLRKKLTQFGIGDA